MTKQQPSPDTPSTKIYLPGIAEAFFILSPILLLIGGFLGRVNAHLTFDWAIFQTMLGTVIFWVGVGLLLVALTLVGVRAIAQQQLDILLQAQGELDSADRVPTERSEAGVSRSLPSSE